MSNETKWTPGPWRMEYDDYGGYDCMSSAQSIYGTESNQRICDLDYASYGQKHGVARSESDCPEAVANARLICAAPEMAAALSAIADLARSITRPSGHPALCRSLLDIEGIARATLARARGES